MLFKCLACGVAVRQLHKLTEHLASEMHLIQVRFWRASTKNLKGGVGTRGEGRGGEFQAPCSSSITPRFQEAIHPGMCILPSIMWYLPCPIVWEKLSDLN